MITNFNLHTTTKKKAGKLPAFFVCDHGGIQTPARWSRNPMLYSAELRGLIPVKQELISLKNVINYLIYFLQSWK